MGDVLVASGRQAVVDVVSAFEKIEATSGRNEKLQYLNDLVSRRKEAVKQIYRLAYDPYIVFGTQMPKPESFGIGLPSFNDFFAVLEGLSSGEIPLGEGRARLVEIAAQSTAQEFKWLERVMWKHLNCGLAETSFYRIFPGVISYFGIQLAQDFDPNSLEDGTPRIVDPKIDGMRAVFIQTKGEGWKGYSRNGKPVYNVDHIIRDLESQPKLQSFVLDGELWAGDFRTTISIARASTRIDPRAETMVLKAFDLIPREEFEKGQFTTKQFERKATLDLLLSERYGGTHLPSIDVVEWDVVSSAEELEETYARVVEQGYEGLMVKDPEAVYAFGRPNYWCKWKPMKEDEFKIVGVGEGGGRLAGTLGALVLEIRPGLTSNVGSGFTDQQRHAIWGNWHDLLGKYATIKYQDIASNGRLRFPIFKGIRETPGGEEVVL